MVNSELSKDMEIMALRALLAEAVHDIGRLVNCKNPCGLWGYNYRKIL